MTQNQFPQGWDQKRVKQVIAHYEGQTEDEALMEDESALENPDETIMVIPTGLVETVRELIAKHQS